MDQILLAEVTMAMADVGDKRAFLVNSMEFPAGGQRVEQMQQIVDCMHAADLHVDDDNEVFGPDSSDSRHNSCAVKMVATVGDGAQDSIKRAAEAFPYALKHFHTQSSFGIETRRT